MLLDNYYYWHTDALPITYIDDIFKFVKNIKYEEALIGQSRPKNFKISNQKKIKRDTPVKWISEQWIYEGINGIVQAANEKAGWNYEWDYSEAVQFTKYNKGKYYGWHCDSIQEPSIYHKPGHPAHGKLRKMSSIIALNDASEYEGGEVEFDFRNKDPDRNGGSASNIVECKELQKKGTVVTFPSYVWHRVKPVTKGVRYSLVFWHLGYPFK